MAAARLARLATMFIFVLVFLLVAVSSAVTAKTHYDSEDTEGLPQPLSLNLQGNHLLHPKGSKNQFGKADGKSRSGDDDGPYWMVEQGAQPDGLYPVQRLAYNTDGRLSS